MQCSALFEKIVRDDPVLARYGLPADAPNERLEQWMIDLLADRVAIEPHRLAAFVAYVLDCFWELGRSIDHAATIAEIDAISVSLSRHPLTASLPTSSISTLPDAVSTSTRMLAFLYDGYLDSLRRNFVGCYLMGSLSYGRFYSVTGNRLDPSDLNLFLIYDESKPELGMLTSEDIEDSLDDRTRFLFFRSGGHACEPSVFNYKLRVRSLGHVLSVNLISLESFRQIVRFDGSLRASLYWDVHLNGRKLLERDLAGRTFQVPYREVDTPFGCKLTIPTLSKDRQHRDEGLGVFCPFAGMIFPRFDVLFTSSEVAAEVDVLVQSTQRLMRAFARAGRNPRFTNAHPRQTRLSPLLAVRLNDKFDHARPPTEGVAL
jgi:hypothetical protein